MKETDRRHDLDWLRLIAIIILLFYHAGMLFNPWNWHIKNADTSESFASWMVWLHYWRMPLLLFISGAGTFLALRKRYELCTPANYVLSIVNLISAGPRLIRTAHVANCQLLLPTDSTHNYKP
ncbi:MAG TPA: acyltransferase family protein [Chryseosolibacter sp.]